MRSLRYVFPLTIVVVATVLLVMRWAERRTPEGLRGRVSETGTENVVQAPASSVLEAILRRSDALHADDRLGERALAEELQAVALSDEEGFSRFFSEQIQNFESRPARRAMLLVQTLLEVVREPGSALGAFLSLAPITPTGASPLNLAKASALDRLAKRPPNEREVGKFYPVVARLIREEADLALVQSAINFVRHARPDGEEQILELTAQRSLTDRKQLGITAP